MGFVNIHFLQSMHFLFMIIWLWHWHMAIS